MSKDRISSKAVSTKGKGNRKPNLSRVHAALDGIKTLTPDGFVHMMRHDFGEYSRAAAAMRKSKDPELCELAKDIDGVIYGLELVAEGFRGVLAKAKSRADELEGR